ncbi:LysR substrate-binding domain-containing protein [Sinomonas sp. P10A9]|uniref:LysR substrate-binding domain-containing protein n=1 Tax=Sinomonas puerhi TaxID=3238584 RepID=A0AB39L4R0_9MICC
METRHLRYFVAVAEERHFGRAAQRLHMAQPPLSQQIKQLEEQLGAALFERTTRKVELTPAGELLLERGRRILQDLEELESDVVQVGRGAAGVLRVGLSGSATYRLLPPLVQRVRSEMPGLRLTVRGEMLTPQMVDDLEEGRLDVAVLRPPVDSPDVELDYLEQDRLVAALPADSPWGEQAELDLAELAGESFVGYPTQSVVTRIFRDACRREGFIPRVVQEAAETSTLLALVAAGMGIALVPMSTRGFAFQGIEFRPVRNAPSVDLAVAWRRGARTPLVRRFLTLFDTVSAPGVSPAAGAHDGAPSPVAVVRTARLASPPAAPVAASPSAAPNAAPSATPKETAHED